MNCPRSYLNLRNVCMSYYVAGPDLDTRDRWGKKADKCASLEPVLECLNSSPVEWFQGRSSIPSVTHPRCLLYTPGRRQEWGEKNSSIFCVLIRSFLCYVVHSFIVESIYKIIMYIWGLLLKWTAVGRTFFGGGGGSPGCLAHSNNILSLWTH